MKAIILQQAGDVEQLVIADLPVPEIKENEVLVEVKAFSINPVDAKTRKGKSLYKELSEHGGPIILGWDISGVIIKTGSAVTQFKSGDEVFGMVNFPGQGRAYAEYVAAPAAHLAKKPANISHEEAAAATLAALTAWQALVTNAKVQNGQKVLIQAAAGGVGHYAVQIAKHLGAYVIATASAGNRDFVLSLGADQHIDYHATPIATTVKEMDFVLDPIGGDNVDASLSVVKRGGTVIALPSVFADVIAQKAKEKGINGYFFMVSSNGDDMKKIASLLEKGIIKSHVSDVFPLEEIQSAHKQIETGRTRGKIVLTVNQ